MEMRNELERCASEPSPDSEPILADLARPEGKTGRNKYPKDRRKRGESKDARGSNLLLELLRHHHDYSVRKIEPLPMAVIKPKAVIQPKERIERKPKQIKFKPVNRDKGPSLEDIRRAVCTYFEIDQIAFHSQRRDQKIVYPRQIAFYLGSTITTRSYPQIGRQYGGKDHTTVLHGSRKIQRLVMRDWQVAFDVAAVESYI